MSVRGMEIHSGYLDFPEGMPQTLHMGTETTPLTQGAADQIIVSAVVNAVALGGVVAGQFLVVVSVSQTGAVKGLHVGTTINDAIVMTGSAWGLHIEQEILGTGSIVNLDGTYTAFWEGIRMEMSSAVGTAMGYGICGIFMSNYNLGTVTGNYMFLRLQENGTAKVTYAIYIRPGSGGCDYAFMFHGANDAWYPTGSVSGAAGWIRVTMGDGDRWIQLYDAGPT